MISLEDALTIRNISLDVEAPDISSAVEKAVALLKNDAQMLDWNAFSVAVQEREKLTGTSVGGGLMLPHGRGDFTKRLVMSFVRLRTPITLGEETVRFVVAVAIPSSMAADYLRLVGALARIFRDPKSRPLLESFATAQEVIDWLSERSR